MTTLGQDVSGQALRSATPAPPRPGPLASRRAAATVALLVLVVPVVTAIVLRRDRWVITSDSVAQQSIVRTWFALGHEQAYVPPDTWLLKVPLYAVVEALPLEPPARLLAESLALAIVMVALLGWACWSLAGQAGLAHVRRPVDVALPFAWLGTLAGGLGSYLTVMPNSRNIELGLGLVVVALGGRWLERRPMAAVERPAGVAARRAATVAATGAAAAALLAALWVDDPYVEALVGLPLGLAALAWFARRPEHGGRNRRLLGLAAVLLTSLALAPVLQSLLAAVGVQVVPDGTAPTLDPGEVLGHLPILGPAVQAQLGLAEHGAAAAAAHVLAVLLLAAAVVAAAAVTVRGWRRGRLAVAFLGVHWLVVVAGVLVNRTIYDFHAGRYLALAFADLAGCLALGPALLRERALEPGRHAVGSGRLWRAGAAAVTAGTAVAVAVNLVSAVRDAPIDPARVQAERLEQQHTVALLTSVASTGRTEAFGPFWTADLYTHLSGGRVQIADVVCIDRRLHRRRWLTDTAREQVRVPRAVVVVPPASSELGGCSADSISVQLGGASRRLRTAGGTTVLVFDHDVASRIGPAPTP